MFPIRDHNPSETTPFVTYLLIAVNIAVFLSYVGILGNERALYGFFADWALIPARLSAGQGHYTIVTSLFLHAGFMHLAGNMLFLWIFGDNLEDRMGHVWFLVFYLACGIGASLIHFVTGPNSMVPTVGASGAIAGVMGGYLLLFPKAKVDILLILIVFFRVFVLPSWILLALWFGIQLIGSLGSDPDLGGVAYWAHTGGFVIGLALTFPLFLSLGGPRFWRRTHGHPDHPVAEYRMVRTSIPRVPRK